MDAAPINTAATFVEPLFWELAAPDTFGEAQIQAILFDGTGFWLTPSMSQKRARTIAAAAQDPARLTALLRDGRGTRIERADIARIEFAPERHVLFIAHGDSGTRITFSSAHDTTTIGKALGAQVFAGRPVTTEDAGTTKKFRKVAHPVPKAIAFAALAVFLNTVARPDYEEYGLSPMRQAINDLYAAVPAAAITLVALIVLVAAGLYHRRTTPDPVIKPFTLSVIEPAPPPSDH